MHYLFIVVSGLWPSHPDLPIYHWPGRPADSSQFLSHSMNASLLPPPSSQRLVRAYSQQLREADTLLPTTSNPCYSTLPRPSRSSSQLQTAGIDYTSFCSELTTSPGPSRVSTPEKERHNRIQPSQSHRQLAAGAREGEDFTTVVSIPVPDVSSFYAITHGESAIEEEMQAMLPWTIIYCLFDVMLHVFLMFNKNLSQNLSLLSCLKFASYTNTWTADVDLNANHYTLTFHSAPLSDMNFSFNQYHSMFEWIIW